MRLENKKIIVSGGPTREWIDPVRYISNASSGKMGVAIADAAYNRCINTVFIHGPVEHSIIANKPYQCIGVETTVDMLEAIQQELSPNTILIMAAAPADYAPVHKSPVKIKKNNDTLTITLKRNPDILKSIANMRKENKQLSDVTLIGFAAETTNIMQYGKTKLVEKELAMICINDVSGTDSGFGSDYNEVTIMLANEETIHLHKMTKKEVAENILQIIETMV
ncbi:MAG TPA: phosphopantothenoylcysteine decarboxylase [Spirochaetota bacterium]|nr:phosphopantothenoylcysteine decarboxylase [Spirochaetota bacterium]